MFDIFFPTSIPAKKEAPFHIRADRFNDDLSFSKNWSAQDKVPYDQIPNSFLTNEEADAVGFWADSGVLIPLEELTAYSSNERLFTVIDPQKKMVYAQSLLARSHGGGTQTCAFQDVTCLVANIFARALGFKSTSQFSRVSNIYTNLPKGDDEVDNGAIRITRPQSNIWLDQERGGWYLENGEWHQTSDAEKAEGSNVRLRISDCSLPWRNNRKPYSFVYTGYQGVPSAILTFLPSVNMRNSNYGKIFFDDLKLVYDTYNDEDIVYNEEGICESTFTKGKTDFGIIARTGWFINEELVKPLLVAADQVATNEEDWDYIAAPIHYTYNVPLTYAEELSGVKIEPLLSHWELRRLVEGLSENCPDWVKTLPPVPVDINCDKEAKNYDEEAVRVLIAILEPRKLWVPVVTPRLPEETCAVLRDASRHIQLHTIRSCATTDSHRAPMFSF